MEYIDILVTVDDNYIDRLKVMLTSLKICNRNEKIRVYLMYRCIGSEKIDDLRKCLDAFEYEFCPVKVDESLFENAPVSKRYPQEMYYRLCAPALLPDTIDKILYLDPDMLVINSIRPLWELDMGEHIFAAASHTTGSEIASNINKIRLGTDSEYFNSGVLLIDLKRGREKINVNDIFEYTKEHKNELLLPDQDVLNALYGNEILGLDDTVWNYDARRYNNYFLKSGGEADYEWVMKNTVILHFCGKAKPWDKHYIYRFGGLYKHYMRLKEIYMDK